MSNASLESGQKSKQTPLNASLGVYVARGVHFRQRQSIIDSLVVTKVNDVSEIDSINGAGSSSIIEAEENQPCHIESEKAFLPCERSSCDLALFEEDTERWPTLGRFLRSFTIPDAKEKERCDSRQKKAKLGLVLGVYLPTMQHIFGVLMFLRLFWIVGTAGVLTSFGLVFLCCSCTFLTAISMSAIATNGVIESGGSYFMISRNLGPEIGSAVGILYYMADAVAAAMYLVGGVEILLTYIAPNLPQFGTPGQQHGSDMFNNFRCYASFLLLLEFTIVALGVRFVQLFAPISLSCVIMSILSVYVGSFMNNGTNRAKICMLGDRALMHTFITINGTAVCNKTLLRDSFCVLANNSCPIEYYAEDLRWIAAIPGYSSGVFLENLWTNFMDYKDTAPGIQGVESRDVIQDLKTNFFILLAIYFPSVTGIMTGSNMSGNLKDPQQSIPAGTIAAQLTTSFVYLSFILIFGATISGPVLRDKYGQSFGGGMVASLLAWPSPWILVIGSFTSTFGAALQSLCSAPRLLQSIAKDDVIPILAPFATLNRFGEPFNALLLTTLIAEGAILIGAIDYIAPIVDFFFLMFYGFINLACVLQTLLKAPNWRPRFRFFHWSLSLLGAMLCFFIMFATYWYCALATLALCAIIYKYVEWRGAKKEWGDGFRGLALTGAQFSLLKIDDKEQHTKNWRPQILVLMKPGQQDRSKRCKLLALSGQLKAGRGLVIAASLVSGDHADPFLREQALSIKSDLKEIMRQNKVKGFALAAISRDVCEGVSVLVQTAGIGALRPNTVLVGWPNWHQHDEEPDKTIYYNFIDTLHRVATANMCLLIPKGIEEFPDYADRIIGCIDVWWVIHDGGLLLLLPFLLKKHPVWRKCKLRIFAVATLKDNTVKMQEDVNRWVYQLRIAAEVKVVEFYNTDISAYTYEKTFMMEERSKFLQQLNLTKREKEMEPQALLDEIRQTDRERMCKSTSALSSPGNSPPADSNHQAIVSITDPFEMKLVDSPNDKSSHFPPISPESPSPYHFTFSPDSLHQLKSTAIQFTYADNHRKTTDGSNGTEDEINVNGTEKNQCNNHSNDVDIKKAKKMHNAVRLNTVIRETSGEAALVIINLPSPPRNPAGLHNYIDYLGALTEGLDRVLLIRGTGKEVITIYS